jgi:UDP-N-acetylglucosamine acyltransferase
VTVGDFAALGGLAAVHQFVRIGAYAFIGAGSMVSQDVPPYVLACGDRAKIYGLNSIGLKRRDFPLPLRRDLTHALRLLQRAPTVQQGIQDVRRAFIPLPPEHPVHQLLAFCEFGEGRGLCASVRRQRSAP